MKTSQKILVSLIITAVAIVSLSGFLFLRDQGEVEKPEGARWNAIQSMRGQLRALGSENRERRGTVFEENNIIYIHVNDDGGARGQLTSTLSKSKFNEVIELSIDVIGEDMAKQKYIQSMRRNLAMTGFEMENASCQLKGLSGEEPLSITIRWNTPHFAQRKENHWSISFSNVDNRVVALVQLLEKKDSWVTVRNIAQTYKIPNARYESTTQFHLVLPEGSQNISYSAFQTEYRINYGGGTYSETSIYTGRVENKFYLIENSHSLMFVENKLTTTVEEIQENLYSYTVTYQWEKPEDWSLLDSISSVRLDLKYGRGLDDEYTISDEEGTERRLTPGQILYCVVDRVAEIESGEEISKLDPPSVSIHDPKNSEWNSCWKELPKDEYLSLAREIRAGLDSKGWIQGSFETSIGEIGYRDILYTYTRILSTYGKNGFLPSSIKFAPSPHGSLSSGNREISGEIPYFLLSSPDVIKDTRRVREVLSEIWEPNLTDEVVARQLLEWANKEISYNYMVFGVTSEEVLESKEGKCGDYTNVYLALLRSAGIPARRVTGWIVSDWKPPSGWEFTVGETPEGKPIAGHAWAQVYLKDRGWIYADPTIGLFENIPYEMYMSVEETWIGALSAYESEHPII